MCDFKPGDEVVALHDDGAITKGAVYRCRDLQPTDWVCESCVTPLLCLVEELDDRDLCACTFRKVQKRSSDLSIERFLTIKPGFEEPRRQPAPVQPERVS